MVLQVLHATYSIINQLAIITEFCTRAITDKIALLLTNQIAVILHSM